jgi:hypothetical protein
MNPFPIGTITTQGVFQGMQNGLAVFQTESGMVTRCNPKLAKVMTSEEIQARRDALAKPRGFFESASLVVEGPQVLELLRTI